jgi:hypothetical protein
VKLNRLWEPCKMHIGNLYAALLLMISLCMVYAPLYPPAFLLCALLLFAGFFCTKFAICYWYAKPCAVDDQMMGQVTRRCRDASVRPGGVTRARDPRQARGICEWVLLLHIMVFAVANSNVDGREIFSDDPGRSLLSKFEYPAVASLAAWVLYMLSKATLVQRLSCFARYGQLNEGEDTDGVRYDQVEALKHYEIERRVTRSNLGSAVSHFPASGGACRRRYSCPSRLTPEQLDEILGAERVHGEYQLTDDAMGRDRGLSSFGALGPNVRVAVTTAELVYEPWVDHGQAPATRGAPGSSARAPLLRSENV